LLLAPDTEYNNNNNEVVVDGCAFAVNVNVDTESTSAIIENKNKYAIFFT
jgi:hypothetical protein